MSEDYYKILSVEPTSSQNEIRKAADRLISIWNEKRDNEKRLEMLTQIRKASAVLTDPLQRFDYDVKQGFRRDFSAQTSKKRSNSVPLKYSESIETLQTVKIPGQLDYEKLEKSIAAIETLTGVEYSSDIKAYSESESLINCLDYIKDHLSFSGKTEISKKSASVESSRLPSYDKKPLDTSSDTGIILKQHVEYR